MTVEQAIERARVMSTAYYGASHNLACEFPEESLCQQLNAQAIELLARLALEQLGGHDGQPESPQ